MQTAEKRLTAVARTQGESITAEPLNLRNRIGSTVYEVNVYFNQDTKETMDEKILHIVKNRLNFAPDIDTMKKLQMGGLPERSSL